jgi:4-amino-4-deoxy-L-arabinose transferase-like glycosyltransferase
MDSRMASRDNSRRLSLVLPAYNEEAGIRQAIVEADEALAALCDDYEILVVDDGSRDATAVVVAEEAAIRPRVRLLRHDSNRGYGAALRTGFEAARFDLVAFTDADCQFYLADLDRLLPLTQSRPIAVGWREDRKDSWLRRFLSRGYNLLTRILLGSCVRDCDCALKIFRREALATILPETTGFFVNVEMLARARQLGYEVAETGVRHRPRLRGKSTVSVFDVPRTLSCLLPFWWSKVLFAGAASNSGCLRNPARRRSPLPALALLLIVAGLLFFSRLGAPLLEPQETRYAEIPRQMLAEGQWLTPILNGQPYLDKPPLLYWSVMASYALFGVHDWAARLVPGLAGLFTVLATYFWGRRAVGDRAGLCGALVLCLSARFVYLERMLTMDCLLCLCTTAGLAAAHAAITSRRLHWGWWAFSATACALGVLTKGPIALVLILIPVVAYCLLDRRGARVSLRHWTMYLAIVLLVAGPWYIAIVAAEPEFAVSFFWKHNVVRFLAPFDHEEPFWFHLPPLILGMLPWSLLLPGFLGFLFRRSRRSASRRQPALGFFVLAALWSLLFFSASGCKRAAYILPAMPPLALALGCYFAALIPSGSLQESYARVWTRGGRTAYRAALFMLTLGAAGALLAGGYHLIKPTAAFALSGGAVAAAAILVVFRRKASWPVLAGTTFAVLFAGVFALQPAYNRQYSLRECLRDVPQTPALPVVCYPQRWDSVSFYLPNADVRAFGVDQRAQLLQAVRTRPGTLLLVKTGPLLEDLMRDLPDSVEFVRHGRHGAITAGWVRARTSPADDLFAQGLHSHY